MFEHGRCIRQHTPSFPSYSSVGLLLNNPAWLLCCWSYLAAVLVRSAKFLVVVALVLSLGGHWAILQMVAWAQMAASFSQTDSLPVAISKTFDGKNPCKLCKLVSEGKKAEKESDSKVETKQVELSFSTELGFYFPRLNQSPQSRIVTFDSRTDVPLSPPPRLV